MTTLLIPLHPGVSSYTVRTTLDGVEFLLGFFFNARDQAWYFSCADKLGAPIVSGVKIRLSAALMRNNVDVRRPLGDFIALDTSNTGEEPNDVDALGNRVILTYVERPA